MTPRIASRTTGNKLGPGELRTYWSRVSERFLARDPDGLAVVCYAGLPTWFNAFLDRYQRIALAKLTRDVDFEGARVLDLGTGSGRWANWFIGRGAMQVVGVDQERQRLGLAQARSRRRPIAYHQMTVDSLGFASEAFDVVNCITVLQHVERRVKERALAEADRVLRPGGHLVLFELTDVHDDAPHVFPESHAAWVDLCRVRGLRVVHEVGDQYTPLLRLAKAVVRGAAGRSGRERIDQFKRIVSGGAARPETVALHALVLLSYPLEELCQRLLPPSAAMITGYLLEKASE